MQSSELLAAVALSLVKHGSLEDRINHVLRIIGSHLNLSRTYVFLDRPGNTVTDNTNEWCSDGIAPQHDELQGFEYSIVPSWRKMLEQDGHIIARDVGMLPVDVATVLQAQGIVSILVIPLYIENRIAGFMGFDQCGTSRGWDVEELPILQAVSGFLSTVLERDYEKKHLSESEANFKRLFDTIDDVIVVANPSGSIVYANAAVSRVLGYSPEELVGMPILEMHPEDRREEAARIIQEMIRRERDTCPLELARKDKSRVSVETRVWFGQWNGQECMYGVSKDLSEHEAQLQMFARLFNENPMPMAISNTGDRCFTDVNTAFLEKLGFSRTEVIGHTSLELDIFPNRTQREYLGRKLEQEGRIVNAEAEVRRKDGRKLHGLFSGGIIDNQGTRQNLTVMMDISEQIHLRDRLDAQRRRLRNIIDSTRLGTWEWDIQSGQTTFNSRWASMLGYTLAELEPTSIETWRNLIVPEDLESSNTLLSSHFSGEAEYYEFEGRMRHKDGRIVWV
ncbi:MAG: PAS domain S-box protein, partial [Spirochaetales bacterium]|nr:PAS domain S-box protein [Spirochaetales bacterium]